MPEQKIDPEAVRRLYSEYRSTRKVAEVLGVTQSGIMDVMIRYNIPRLSTSESMVGKSAEWNKTIDIEKAKELYLSQKSTAKVAQMMGHSQYGIWNALKKAGVDLREIGAPSGEDHWTNSVSPAHTTRGINAFGFDFTKEWCEKALVPFGGNAKACAKHYGFKYTSFVTRLKQFGVARLAAPVRKAKRAPFDVNEAQALSSGGTPYDELATKYGVSPAVVSYWLKKAGHNAPRNKMMRHSVPRHERTRNPSSYIRFSEICKERGEQCEVCGVQFPLEMSRIWEGRRGGPYVKENVVLLCQNHSHLFDFPRPGRSLSKEEFESIKPRVRAAEALYGAPAVRDFYKDW